MPTLAMSTSIYRSDSERNIIGISNFSNSTITDNLNHSNFYNDPDWFAAYDSSNGQLEFGEIEPINMSFPTKTFQQFLYQNKGEWADNALSYGSFFVNPLDSNRNIYLGLNVSSIHSLPIMVNLFNNWMLNTLYTEDVTISLSNRPMKQTDIQIANANKVINQILGSTMVMMLLFGLILIPGNSIYWVCGTEFPLPLVLHHKHNAMNIMITNSTINTMQQSSKYHHAPI